jgi:hypothetical protein
MLILISIEIMESYPGDSLPYPKMTKEELDIELDQICNSNSNTEINLKNHFV